MSTPSGPPFSDRPRRDGQGSEHRIKESLETFLRASGHGHAAALAAVSEIWPAVVGEEVAAHVVPRTLRAGTLVVAVDEAAWATQFAFLSEGILDGLEAALGERVVERVEATVRLR